MNQNKQVILICSSHLLSYPTDENIRDWQDMKQIIENEIQTEKVGEELKQAFTSLLNYSVKDIRELYVKTFDLRAKTGLYLTAHELGDSNRRGAALIRLQKIINQARFERDNNELVDYIPMLLEFLAVSQPTMELERLERRLAVAIQRIINHIEEDNPYTKVLNLLMTHIFHTPSVEEIEQLENDREEADLEELPYPIMYQ
ncbi:nitrate reductase molybdenum cofactor assembly chaperone [Bacillaceae bacterium W0354]